MTLLQVPSGPCHLGAHKKEDIDRPKRRRKPQKPGKTAKQNDRHFVVHNYHDHAFYPDENDECQEESGMKRRGGVATSFPTKLHSILDQVEADGLSHIISWQPHGRCFIIHKPKEFADYVMPRYFRQSKLTSFQRQLNLYGFCRLTRGRDSGGYYHELFLRSRAYLAKKMQRTKIKGTKFKAASNPDQEPDFYSMPPVGPSLPKQVSDDSSAEDSKSKTLQAGFASGKILFSDLQVPSMAPLNKGSGTFGCMMNLEKLEPYPLLDPSHVVSGPRVTHGMIYDCLRPVDQMELRKHDAFQVKPESDDVLDQAVDELFMDSDDLTQMDYSGNISNLWDLTEFGQESYEEDVQLGFMLEELSEA